ncbi:hypothetical protein PENTCL1PPCAC_400, partial [Pristionchus entomophagus]
PMSDALRDLLEENNKLRAEVARLTEERRKHEEQISQLSESLADLQLFIDNQASQYTSKFAKEFKVESILGTGLGGCVFEAKNVLDERKYAMKRIHVDPNDAKIAKTLREVRAMAQLDHPNIVRYNSTWIEEPPRGWQRNADAETLTTINPKARDRDEMRNYSDDSFFIYIQMQICNYSLEDWLSSNMTKESRNKYRMKGWFKQMVNAVHYIHERKLIHRDLKPLNILFADRETIKICDLGIVVEKNVESGEEVTMTRTGTGTEMYMSPEQRALVSLNVSHITSASDVFTLGLILCELFFVMDEYEKGKMFDKYRAGKADVTFDDARTAEFIGKLTVLDRKKRLTCKQMLDHMYLS